MTKISRFSRRSVRGFFWSLVFILTLVVLLGLWLRWPEPGGEVPGAQEETTHEEVWASPRLAEERAMGGGFAGDRPAPGEAETRRQETAGKLPVDPGFRSEGTAWGTWAVPGEIIPADPEDEVYIVRRGLLHLDAEAVAEWLKSDRSQPVELRLFEDTGFVLEIYRVDHHPDQVVSLYGRLDEEELGTVVLSGLGGRFLGDLLDLASGRSFVIKPSAETGLHLVEEIDPQRMPPRIHIPVPIPEDGGG